MGAKEYALLALVVGVPLIVAVAVTLWSLEQVRYRPKRKGTVRTAVGPHRSGPAAPGDPTVVAPDDSASTAGPVLPLDLEPEPGAAVFGFGVDAGSGQRPPEYDAANDGVGRASG